MRSSLTKGIELLNEPRLSDDFSMKTLKSFYTSGAEAVRSASSELNITAHGESSWSDRLSRAGQTG